MRAFSWITARHSKSPKHLGTQTSTDSAPSSSSNDIACGSLNSHFSLQTLPSLQTVLSPDNPNDAVFHTLISSFKPQKQSLQVTFLAVYGGKLYVASGHEIGVYDHATCTHLDTFSDQDSSSGSVKSMAFSAGKILTAHQDGKIRVWEITASRGYIQLTTLPTLNDRLRRLAIPGNYVQLRRHCKRLWIEHADAVTALAVNNGVIYSVSWDKTLKVWRGSDFRCLESVKAHDDAVNAVVVSESGTVFTGSADGRIKVWERPLGTKRHILMTTLEKHKSGVNTLALNEDGSILFSGSCDRSILVWEREDGSSHMSVTGALMGHENATLSLVYVSGMLFSGSADRTVRIWRRRIEGRYCCLAVLVGHLKPVKSLAAVSEKGSNDVSLVSGSLDGEVNMWHISKMN